MVTEITDWIAIGTILISLGSLIVAAIALIDSRRARAKVQLLEQEKHRYEVEKDLHEEKKEFLFNVLRSDKIAKYRLVLYDHYCSNLGDAQALDNDNEYKKAVYFLRKRHDDINYILEENDSLINDFTDSDWAAIIKTNKALLEKHKNEALHNLVNLAKERLRNARINTDPCK